MSLSPKLMVLAGVVVASMVFLMARTMSGNSGVYYLDIDEYLAKPIDHPVRVAGFVADGSIRKDPSGLVVRFTLRDARGEKSMPVLFDAREGGARIPDTFTDGSQVLVSGKMGGGGEFEAKEMLAKCPSKYEARGQSGRS